MNMKRIAILGAMLLPIALGACADLKAAGTADLAAIKTDSKTLIADVQARAVAYCATKPTGGSISAVVNAVSGTLSVEDIALTLCDGFKAYQSFAADDGKPVRRARAKKGQTVTGTVVVNGKVVPIQGTVTK
jgi:hypothetical protein